MFPRSVIFIILKLLAGWFEMFVAIYSTRNLKLLGFMYQYIFMNTNQLNTVCSDDKT